MRLLIVTAVAGERDAILELAPDAEILVGGVGPAAAAASTARALALGDYDLVISAGIAGGYPPLANGQLAVASACVFADLGLQSEDGFVPLSALGLGPESFAVGPRLAIELADVTGGHIGTILTVAQVTGSAATAHARQRRYPDAVAEAMEGAGVATAATQLGMPFAEVRAISNAVGPRDRDSWDIPAALDALGGAVAAIVAADWAS